MPQISVIIPVHHDGEEFRRCLMAVRNSTRTPEETIVVSDGAPASVRSFAHEQGARVLHTPTAQGPAHARNKGAQAASGDVLFFLDADVLVHSDAIEKIVQWFDPSEHAALIGSYDDAPDDDAFLSQYRNLLHHYTHQHGNEETITFWGACGAIRAEAFWAVGGFDADYERPSIEDIEFGHRLREAGYSIWLDPAVQVTHLKAWSADSMIKTDVLDRALPWTRLLLEQGTLPNDLNVRRKERWSTVAAFALPLFLLASAWVPALSGLAAGMGFAFLLLNRSFYQYLRRKRGLWFSIKAIPWHWVYYLCCGTGAALGLLLHALSQVGLRKTPLHDLLPRPSRVEMQP
jgi:GT2 family glycosyltransferase